MNNKVFYQHPNLMRVLGMHETVMEVMVNVLGGGKSQVPLSSSLLFSSLLFSSLLFSSPLFSSLLYSPLFSSLLSSPLLLSSSLLFSFLVSLYYSSLFGFCLAWMTFSYPFVSVLCQFFIHLCRLVCHNSIHFPLLSPDLTFPLELLHRHQGRSTWHEHTLAGGYMRAYTSLHFKGSVCKAAASAGVHIAEIKPRPREDCVFVCKASVTVCVHVKRSGQGAMKTALLWFRL